MTGSDADTEDDGSGYDATQYSEKGKRKRPENNGFCGSLRLKENSTRNEP
jgi:hypothetical protein